MLIIEILARQAPNSYRYKKEWMDKNSQSVKILVLGSSHTFYGINPEYMKDKCFNLANLLQSFYYDDYLLRKYINKSSSLRYVILPVSAVSLYGKLEESEGWYRIINYELYMGCDDYKGISKYNFEISNFRNAVKKVGAYIRKKDKVLCNSLGFNINYSHNRKRTNWNDGLFVAKRYFANAENWTNYKENVGYLYDMASLCREKNIKLILITTPTMPSYYKNLNHDQMDCNSTTIKDLKLKFKNVFYYDFLNDKRFKSDDFFNADHLSDVGALKFTLLLQDSIINIPSNQ